MIEQMLPYVGLIALAVAAVMGYASLQAKVRELATRRKEDKAQHDKEIGALRAAKTSNITKLEGEIVKLKDDMLKAERYNNGKFDEIKTEIHESEKRIIVEIHKKQNP